MLCYCSNRRIRRFRTVICETEPIAICDSVISYCEGLKVLVSGVPDAATVTWSPTITATNSWTGAGRLYTFTAPPTTGLYTVTAVYGSHTVVGTVRIITAATSAEYPCNFFTPQCATGCSTVPFKTIYAPDDILSGDRISTSVAGYYFIPYGSSAPAKLRVSPKEGSYIVFQKNKGLVIEPGYDITISGCHVIAQATGGDNIISIQSTSSSKGKLTLTNNTLIENFSTGVNVEDFNHGYPASDYILNVNGAIFNHNVTDVNIDNTNSPDAFSFKNSVWTNRNFCAYHKESVTGCTDYYPFSWPGVSYLKTKTADGLSPGYNIDGFSLYSTGSTGIKLRSVGTTTGTTTYTYTSIVVGDNSDAGNTNMFDGKKQAASCIYANGANNVVLYNNIFRESDHGVRYANSVSAGLLQLDANTAVPGTHNRFANCSTAVLCNPCNTLISRYTRLASTNTRSSIKAHYGYVISSSIAGKTHLYDIRYDTFANIATGIFSYATANCNTGNCNIVENVMTGITTGATNSYGSSGIFIVGCGSSATGTIRIANNNISGYDIGINVSSMQSAMRIDSNVVNIQKPDAITGRSGIRVNGNSPLLSSISRNHVFGDGVNVDYNLPNVTGANMYRGLDINGAGQTGNVTDISCNYVHNIMVGFIFRNANVVNWHHNVMRKNKYGLFLSRESSTAAVSMGDQGSMCNPSDNRWYSETGWDGWNTTGTYPCYQTFASGANAALSTLYIRTGTETEPIHNGSATAFTVAGTAYQSGVSYFDAVAGCSGSVADPDYSCSSVTSYASRLIQDAGDNSNGNEPGNIAKGDRFVLYPNPAVDEIMIRSTELLTGEVAVHISNYAGQEVYNNTHSFAGGSATIKMTEFVPGIYVVTLSGKNGYLQRVKVVVQK